MPSARLLQDMYNPGPTDCTCISYKINVMMLLNSDVDKNRRGTDEAEEEEGCG